MNGCCWKVMLICERMSPYGDLLLTAIAVLINLESITSGLIGINIGCEIIPNHWESINSSREACSSAEDLRVCEQGTPNVPESVPVQFVESFCDNCLYCSSTRSSAKWETFLCNGFKMGMLCRFERLSFCLSTSLWILQS